MNYIYTPVFFLIGMLSGYIYSYCGDMVRLNESLAHVSSTVESLDASITDEFERLRKSREILDEKIEKLNLCVESFRQITESKATLSGKELFQNLPKTNGGTER